MFRAHKVLMLVLAVVLLFAAVPLVGAQDEPPQPPPQQPPQPTDPNVNVNVDVPWGTILVGALILGIILMLVASMGRTSTHTIERVDERHHHDLP